MNKEQKPEAIRLAEKLRYVIHLLDCDFADDIDTNDLKLAAMEIESLHARVQELKGQLEAVRAGGDSTDEVTVLPDGSAFAVYSYPLPKGHWLYAPREYEQGAEEPKELAAPILTHAAREQVISAIRYAVRGATDCGRETDFDPDALVQNAVYALCGPFNKNQPQPQAAAQTAALLEREAFEAWWRENVSQGLAEIDHDYRYWALWQARAAPLNVWQQAIDAELVSAHLGVAPNDATFEGARKALHELICWHIDVATNPATNGGQRLTDAKPILWPEPAGRLITGPHGLFVSYNSSIAATPGNLYTSAQVEAMLEAQG